MRSWPRSVFQAVLYGAAAPHKSVGTKVSAEEFAALEGRARTAGLTLSGWVRNVLLAGPGADRPSGEAAEVVLAELLALRSLFLNLSFRADKGVLQGGAGSGLQRLLLSGR